MKMINFRLLYTLVSLVIVPIAMADNYFDDDIYYDASKDKSKTQKVEVVTKSTTTAISQPVSSIDYSSYSGSMRDVDEYNRQGIYSDIYSDTVSYDSVLNIGGYTYTNRIERFYNPEIVSSSGNQELIDSYSNNQSVVNIYVDSFWDPYPGWAWNYSYPRYSWNYTFYAGVWNPYWPNYYWYNPWYDPWYCAPYYPYYGHHHHHGPTYSPHHSGVRPASSGAYRPHRPGNRTSGVSRPGYTRRGNNSSFGSGNGANRGRSSNMGIPTNSSRPSNMSEGRGNYRSTPGRNQNNMNFEGTLQQNNSNKAGVGLKEERRSRSGNNRSVSTGPNKSSSNNNSYSRPGNSNSNHNSSGSYSRPSSGGSNRGSGSFSGGGSRGGGRGRR